MCGVAGIISNTSSEFHLRAMLDAMKHRGPDDQGVWIKDDIHLGHNRLAIIDLSPAGHQPMVSPDGRYVIVYNGEIYNFQELKKQFFFGETFHSGSDTEVLLRLFAKIGIDCVQHLRGMFAFLIWDMREHRLWGARDRMGIKPLWYHRSKNHLVVGSEIKAILASKLVDFELESEAIRQYMLYGSVQFPNSFIKEVFSIPPASWFCFQEGKLSIKTYWTFPTETDESYTFSRAKEEFKDVYEESIRLRMIADRTVGVFLSSGLDSVSLLACLKRMSEHQIRTFTIGFETSHHKFFSETNQAAALSDHFGFPNDSVIIDAQEATSDINSYIYGLDQPSIDGINTYLVSKYSKDLLTVALSGLGGDELMLGYPRNINLFNLLRRKIKLPRKLIESYLIQKAGNSGKKNRYMDALMSRVGGSANLKLLYWNNRLINPPWLVNEMMQTDVPVEKDLENFYKFDQDPYHSNTFNEISYYEMRSFMLSQLLRDMDAVSMSQSIEVRFPMIDHKLVEFMFRLPSKFKYSPQGKQINHKTGTTTYASSGIKHLLAEAYKDDLPKGYLDGPKQGFQLPYREWMAVGLENDIYNTLDKASILKDHFNLSSISMNLSNLNKGHFEQNAHLMYVLGKWDEMIKEVSALKTNVSG